MTTSSNGDELNDLSDAINRSIDQIVDRNMNVVGMPSISKLYSRINSDSPKNTIINGLEQMFNEGTINDDLYTMFMNNRYLREFDDEVDTVCRYMTKLEEAILAQKDAVLSADHFSKQYLSAEPDIIGDKGSSLFDQQWKDMMKKYKIEKLIEDMYYNTSKYGEQFIYRVPYSYAIGKLLATKTNTPVVKPSSFAYREDAVITESTFDRFRTTYLLSVNSESCTIRNVDSSETVFTESAPQVLRESVEKSTDNGQVTVEKMAPLFTDKEESFNIGIEINTSGMIDSAILEHYNAVKVRSKYSTSLAESYKAYSEAGENKKDIKAAGSLKFPGYSPEGLSSDGLISPTADDKEKIVDVKAPGCVVKVLKRDQIYPIYIDDMCMGYYYLELRSQDESNAMMGFRNMLGNPITTSRAEARNSYNNVSSPNQDYTIRYIAGELSKFIDKQFVNANQDLAKEIYMILKYNDLFNTPSIDLIRVTFLPPEDVVHSFFNQNPDTHRGVSDIDKGLVPAKVYTSLYMTTAIGTITRGFDKRVYYVKQQVDQNIAGTLLNTINQIKQGNFGIRQFQSINTILNITGRFNDYVIPTNSSGDPPIQFEVMPGQQFEAPSELMERLEEMAINSTGIPLELIQARQSLDYAMQLTMSSSKALRFCYKRQELFQEIITNLINPIYNYEYGENIRIKITLPPPSFINITNTNQLVDNTKTFVQSLVDIEIPENNDDPDNAKLRSDYFTALFYKYIGTHIDVSSHKEILDRCKVALKKDYPESHADTSGENGEEDYGQY